MIPNSLAEWLDAALAEAPPVTADQAAAAARILAQPTLARRTTAERTARPAEQQAA